jgi:hypothetical protein
MKRENGYYWVKVNSDDGDEWVIAQYNGSARWSEMGSEDGLLEEWILEIDERKIVRQP